MRVLPVRKLRKLLDSMFGETDADFALFRARGSFAVDKDGELAVVVGLEAETPAYVGTDVKGGVDLDLARKHKALGAGEWMVLAGRGITAEEAFALLVVDTEEVEE